MGEQVTTTQYDVRDAYTVLIPSGYITDNTFQRPYTLRNRVSTVRNYDFLKTSLQGNALYSGFNSAITYSYDIHGNVDTLLNSYHTGMISTAGYNRYKLIAYRYDLISGKVNEVHYQPGMADEFYHRYGYDAENRLTDVYSTTRKELLGIPGMEDHEAYYSYYKHGPLARIVLGQSQVQGIDYAYTLQGWLKGINSTSLNPAFDMGADGQPNTANAYVTRDAFSYSLNYFTGDYAAINQSNPFPGTSAYLNNEYRPLYNGNISSMTVNIGQFKQPLLYNYRYDQLNRLLAMNAYKGLDEKTNSWAAMQSTLDYAEKISYDANGNIQKYQRNREGGVAMDNLTYNYYLDSKGQLRNNQLSEVRDAVSTNTGPDIHDQPAGNYSYDEIGNLLKDKSENITGIDWSL